VKTGLESTATTKAHRVGNSLVVKLIEKLGGLWVVIKFFLQTIERRPVLAIGFIMVPVLCFANGCKYHVTISMNVISLLLSSLSVATSTISTFLL
jgi:hypothetical protein